MSIDAIATASFIELAAIAGEVDCPNLLGSAECYQRQSGAPRLDEYHALAPAQRQSPKPGHAGLGYRRTDDAIRFHSDHPVRVHVITGVEVDRVDISPRHEAGQIDC